jgi:hypothetical protein
MFYDTLLMTLGLFLTLCFEAVLIIKISYRIYFIDEKHFFEVITPVRIFRKKYIIIYI